MEFTINALLIFSITAFLFLAGCAQQQAPADVSGTSDVSDVSSDPFGSPPKPAEFNCGPEERYKFDVTIASVSEFVDFLKNNLISDWVRLDSFRDSPEGEVDWDAVSAAVTSEKVGSRQVYSLEYIPEGHPSPCSAFTVKMTSDGHVSVYGCCGK